MDDFSGRTKIANVTALCPASGLSGVRDLWVEGGKLLTEDPGGAADRVVDGAGLMAVPGFIELHAHLREPGFTESETVATGLAAALAGGYTAVFAMANTRPPNDHPDVTRGMLAAAKASGLPVRLYPVAAATLGLLGREPADYLSQKAAGAAAVSDDGLPLLDDAVMAECMRRAAEAGLPILDHATHGPASGKGVMHEGACSRSLGFPGLPREEEDTLVARDIGLARESGHPVHIQHISTAGGVQAVRAARAEGVPVTAEATPHHLLLTDRDVAGPGEKMNPPLREEEDRRAVLAGLLDGTIDLIATDHAPHHRKLKERGMLKAPFGVIGMESAFPALYTGLVDSGEMPLPLLIDLLTRRPARIGGVPGGSLAAGRPVELNLLDVETPFRLVPESLRSKSENCPFLHRELKGRVVATVVGEWIQVHHAERFRYR
jgi:dihydroorotase